MTSNKNIEFKKTSFLNKSNSAFIEEMYVKFIEGDTTIPQSWKSYFEDLGEDLNDVIKEIEGPNWKPNKIKINLNQENLKESQKVNQINIKDSIKAIALIRAYRIRGHLIANLDPLGIQKREEHPELKPETYGFNIGNLVLSFLIFVWAIRLGMFLFLRIQKDGEDKRFGSIKPSATKFFMTWTIQATWVSICSLCALTGISSNSGVVINNLFFLGLTFFIVGFFIEVVADIQKTKFRKNPKNKNNFITTGLWAYSRHPNYLGEISIWTGISIISFSSLSNLQYVTLISPIFTYVLLVYVSGVNLLEESGNKKWGHLKGYKEYIQKTPRLLF